MSLSLNIHSTAIKLSRSLRNAQVSGEISMERLSSGNRVNSAKDDPAGISISYRLDSQIRGAEMSIRNAQDGISAAQIADAALAEIQNISVRVREIAVQKASGHLTELDKANVEAEITQLNSEIERITKDTKFNTHILSGLNFQTVLSGTNESTNFQIPVFPATAGQTSAQADEALESIATARATLGAYVNRLDHASANLSNIGLNTKTAKSRIIDADLATEAATMAKAQVLAQTSSSLLAQANAAGEYVLQLIT